MRDNNRNAEQQAATSLVSGTCRFEELLLTSANEDESRRLSSVQAIYHLLQNGEEQSLDSSPSEQEESTPVLSRTPSTTPNPFISFICRESRERSFLWHIERSYLTLASVTKDLLKRLQMYYDSSEYNQMEATMVGLGGVVHR